MLTAGEHALSTVQNPAVPVLRSMPNIAHTAQFRIRRVKRCATAYDTMFMILITSRQQALLLDNFQK